MPILLVIMQLLLSLFYDCITVQSSSPQPKNAAKYCIQKANTIFYKS